MTRVLIGTQTYHACMDEVQLPGWDERYSDHDLNEAIGQVAVSGSLLETALRDIVAGLLGTDLGRVVTAGESTSAMVDMCGRLLSYREGLSVDIRAELRSWLESARTLSDQRNHVVHSTWFSFSDLGAGQHLARRSRRHRSLQSEAAWSAEDVRVLARDIRLLVAHADDIWHRAFWEDYVADRRAEMLDEPIK